MNIQVSEVAAEIASVGTAGDVHSPYLVNKLLTQSPNLYGTVKFKVVADHIRKLGEELGRPPRVLDLGCSTSISREYLAGNDLDFEYCGVDYEAAFAPDIVMDVRRLYAERDRLPWQPDVIMLLDVLEHLPGKAPDIAKVMRECNLLIPAHGSVLVMVPQLYRLDRLKLPHLHYPEHQVRFTLREWQEIIGGEIRIERTEGVGYLSCLPYLPMLSPWYKEDNGHGRLFHYLRGKLFEWGPLKPAEVFVTRLLGSTGLLKGWCNSSFMICRGESAT
ncbi:MAG: methyltransferase domain-containing protein [Pseudomonadota bacterium]